MNREGLRKGAFVVCLAAAATPWLGTTLALVLGMGFGLILGNPWPRKTARMSKIALQVSVVGLGFGLELGEVVQTGRESVVYTMVGISCTIAAGFLLGRLFGNRGNTSALITFGTAICGGSAIAALAPVIEAEDEETAVALATVFTLNSVALLAFPLVGHLLHLDQRLFGTWAGLAIHDTSSVVGAAAAYGSQALAVGTTVKLTRALWITRVVILAALFRKSRQKIAIPLFIIGFVVAATMRTLLPQYHPQWDMLATAAKQCLVVTLFLIGTGLRKEVLQEVGLRPLLQGVSLWLLVSTLTLAALLTLGLV